MEKIFWIVYSVFMIMYLLKDELYNYRVSKVNINNAILKCKIYKTNNIINIDVSNLSLIEATAVIKYYHKNNVNNKRIINLKKILTQLKS